MHTPVTRRRARFGGTLTAAALVLLSALAPAAVAAPSGGTATFGIGPASAKGIDGRPYLQFLASPGAQVIDRVAVQNYATSPVRIRVYSADAETTRDGAVSFAARSSRSTGAGAWIALPGGAPTFTIPARQVLVVPIQVTVPRDATPGDHAAAVIASLTSSVRSKTGQQVALEQRLALRAYFRISGPLHPRLSVTSIRARYLGTADPVGEGRARITYTVTNTGNVRLQVKQRVWVSGLLGRSSTVVPPDLPLLLPGGSATLSVLVQGVRPALRSHAHVELTPVVFAGDVDGHVPAHYSRAVGFWTVPWTVLALLAGLLLLGAGYRLLRVSRRTPGRHAVAALPPSDPVPAGRT